MLTFLLTKLLWSFKRKLHKLVFSSFQKKFRDFYGAFVSFFDFSQNFGDVLKKFREKLLIYYFLKYISLCYWERQITWVLKLLYEYFSAEECWRFFGEQVNINIYGKYNIRYIATRYKMVFCSFSEFIPFQNSPQTWYWEVEHRFRLLGAYLKLKSIIVIRFP